MKEINVLAEQSEEVEAIPNTTITANGKGKDRHRSRAEGPRAASEPVNKRKGTVRNSRAPSEAVTKSQPVSSLQAALQSIRERESSAATHTDGEESAAETTDGEESRSRHDNTGLSSDNDLDDLSGNGSD